MPGPESGNEWIRVLVGDLANQPADAVVRPADAALGPAEPAATRLDEVGGEAFALLRRNTTPLEAGAAVVTGGGALLAPLVLHVVVSDPARKVGRELLRKALVSAWQRAGDWGLATIATPPVGVGALAGVAERRPGRRRAVSGARRRPRRVARRDPVARVGLRARRDGCRRGATLTQ